MHYTFISVNLKKLTFLFFFISISFESHAQNRVGLMGALDQEIELVLSQMTRVKTKKIKGITFYEGKLGKEKVVLLKSGVGKVNAAFATATLLHNYRCKHLLFTGVAGGLHPEAVPGDIVIGDSLIQYDFGRLSNGSFELWPTRNLDGPNPTYFKSDPNLALKAKEIAQKIDFEQIYSRPVRIFHGAISTADLFVSDSSKALFLYKEYNALATEMEGAAVAQICYQQRVPFLILRSCSDNAGSSAHMDFTAFVRPAARNSAALVLALLKEFSSHD